MNYSICVDNHDLTFVGNICVDWQTPFLSLYFDREEARKKHFADNGKNWQYSDTDDSFRTTLLDVYLDENDHITGLSIYKYQATSFNHGRNNSKELKATALDIKKCTAALQEVVIDPTEDELNMLLNTLTNSDFGQERQVSVRKNDIVLLDQRGQRRMIKRSTLLSALQGSRVYTEILYNDKVFELYPKAFPVDIWPVLHEILSLVDTKEYYHINDLIWQMKMRELIAGADDHYPQLRQAVINEDLEEVTRLAEYARLVPESNPEGSPLYHAVKQNSMEMTRILLENGAYTLEMDRDGSCFPLETAYQNGNREIVRLLIDHHGAEEKTYAVTKHNTENFLRMCAQNKDYEILSLLPPEAFSMDTRTWLTPDMFPDMDEGTIQSLSRISCRGRLMLYGQSMKKMTGICVKECFTRGLWKRSFYTLPNRMTLKCLKPPYSVISL